MGDHPDHSAQASALLVSLEHPEVLCHITDIVIFETVYLLSGLYAQPKEAVRDVLKDILNLPGVIAPNKSLLVAALDLFVRAKMSFPDAYHTMFMQSVGISRVVSFDRDFDGVAEIQRIEPNALLSNP